MDKIFKFKTSKNRSLSVPDSEALFRDLKYRKANVQHLWSQQADILREYHKIINNNSLNIENIALELPTGSGKTLVGLLIAEWRRRNFLEKPVYLCPTRQLAKQVKNKADEYGIKAHAFVGQQKLYPVNEFNEFLSSEAIGITTYSGLFNINPKIKCADLIVLDDAHAGESYIVDMYSAKINRNEHRMLYQQIVELFASDLRDYLRMILKNDEANISQKKDSLYLLPTTRFYRKIKSLTQLLEENATGENGLYYPWSQLRRNLHACYIFFSWSEILIRPWIPPTLTHEPFSCAKQRIYMSATLGESGELERITGVSAIHRIPVPPGWEKQSTGRRLFIFPDRSFRSDAYFEWLANFLNENNRILVLSPNSFVGSQFEAKVADLGCQHVVLKSNQIEDSIDPFTNCKSAILSLTNRYDGIDLPDDSCRVLIICGLPASVNLHESFLWSKLRLNGLLRERIRTRITQASGRCTRSSTDYAVIIMVGSELFEFCIKSENKRRLHPELRAELEFGIENSETDDIEQYNWVTRIFLNRAEEWSEAEVDINDRRNDIAEEVDECAEKLKSTVKNEVKFHYHVWNENFEDAIAESHTILELLSGGKEIAGFRSLWHYFSGCAHFLHAESCGISEYRHNASKKFDLAAKTSPLIQWFSLLKKERHDYISSEDSDSGYSVQAVGRINDLLTELGAEGLKYNKHIAGVKEKLNSGRSTDFDAALTEIGRLLGFDSEQPPGNGAPDSIWKIDFNRICIFECKSSEKEQHGISIDTCRQAQGHYSWYKSNNIMSENCAIDVVVVSPRKLIDKDALPHTENLYYVHVDEIIRLYETASDFFRSIRDKVGGLEPEYRAQTISEEIKQRKISPEDIIRKLTSNALKGMNYR